MPIKMGSAVQVIYRHNGGGHYLGVVIFEPIGEEIDAPR